MRLLRMDPMPQGRGFHEAETRRCGGGVGERERAAGEHAIDDVFGGDEYG